MERFVVHWGEMGTQWGINRTVAQVHALLFLSPTPLHAEQIAATIHVARSNVSTSIKELLSWKIVRKASVLGDRRDHYESIQDVWQLFQIILDERKKREIDPTLMLLRECVAEMDAAPQPDKYTLSQLRDLLGFMESMSVWYTQIRNLPQSAAVRFFKMGQRVGKWGSSG